MGVLEDAVGDKIISLLALAVVLGEGSSRQIDGKWNPISATIAE